MSDQIRTVDVLSPSGLRRRWRFRGLSDDGKLAMASQGLRTLVFDVLSGESVGALFRFRVCRGSLIAVQKAARKRFSVGGKRRG